MPSASALQTTGQPAGPSQAPAQANSASNEQASAVVESTNIQTGLNNNTVQSSQDKTPVMTVSRVPSVDGNGGNESNGNTNTAGDQTAVNGNNFQQSNEQNQSTTQSRSGGACCVETDGRSNDTHGASQQNGARSEQGWIVAGAQNVQTGLNNNTVQIGSGNKSNGNTNTVGDQTAVNGNNFQQSNEQTSSNKGNWKRQEPNRDDCHSGCAPKRPSCDGGSPRPGADNESNGNTNTVGDQTAVNGNNFQQSNEQSSGKGDWKGSGGSQQNRAHNEQYSLVLGAENVQTGLNNNTVQVSGAKEYAAPALRTVPMDGRGGGGNESNGNTNTAGDQTAVNGNNFQQSNESNGGSGGNWKGPGGSPGGSQQNTASNHQGAIVLRGLNVQTGLNNNTVQIGSGNESNHNTNTVGDQTAVNGNNYQQSNESNGSRRKPEQRLGRRLEEGRLSVEVLVRVESAGKRQRAGRDRAGRPQRPDRPEQQHRSDRLGQREQPQHEHRRRPDRGQRQQLPAVERVERLRRKPEQRLGRRLERRRLQLGVRAQAQGRRLPLELPAEGVRSEASRASRTSARSTTRAPSPTPPASPIAPATSRARSCWAASTSRPA